MAYVYVHASVGHIVHDGTSKLLLFDQTLDDGVSEEALDAKRLVSRTEGETLDIAFPIMIENQLLGGVEVGFSLREVTSDIATMKDDSMRQQT